MPEIFNPLRLCLRIVNHKGYFVGKKSFVRFRFESFLADKVFDFLFTLLGKNLVSDPIFNKGLGFPPSERDRLGIRGLVPPTRYVCNLE